MAKTCFALLSACKCAHAHPEMMGPIGTRRKVDMFRIERPTCMQEWLACDEADEFELQERDGERRGRGRARLDFDAAGRRGGVSGVSPFESLLEAHAVGPGAVDDAHAPPRFAADERGGCGHHARFGGVVRSEVADDDIRIGADVKGDGRFARGEPAWLARDVLAEAPCGVFRRRWKRRGAARGRERRFWRLAEAARRREGLEVLCVDLRRFRGGDGAAAAASDQERGQGLAD
mmetsp:Transcript_17005/g.57466  ORF Transcript_17005/g.57466 Transcript_17005/m.57466 type:complete len:233 (-) Transcript_17005:696-1394(-)